MRGRAGSPLFALLSVLAFLTAASGSPPDRSVVPPIDGNETFRTPSCTEQRLANGLRLLVVERRAVPSVHLVWSVSAGSAEDPPHLYGVAALLAETLAREPREGGESLAETLRDRGVLLEVEIDRDSIRFSVQAPADRLRWAVRRLGRALFRLPEGTRTARALLLADLARRSDDPERLLDDAAWRAVYGESHAYGRPVWGRPATLNGIGPADLRLFHQRWFRTDRMVVTAAGDVDVAALRRELERLKPVRADAVKASRQVPSISPDRPGGRRIVLLDRPGSNSATIGLAARLSLDVGPLDPAALVANQLLGGPSYSRLLGALRNELGYAYDAGSWIEFRRQGALLLARSTVGAENAAPALRRLLAEVEALQRKAPPEEIARARVSLRNGLLAGWFETNRSVARAWARLALAGLDREMLDDRLRGIAAVQADGVARFAREHLQPERLLLLVVGDAGRLAGPLGELGLGPVEPWDADLTRRATTAGSLERATQREPAEASMR